MIALAASLTLGASSPSKKPVAENVKLGRETGLPLPRFVSLKASKVNLRVGPGRKYPIAWQFKKRGLPVEVIQEFDQWRRIRYADGATGWVLHSLLSSRRTAIVAPWETAADEEGKPIHVGLRYGKKSASANSAVVARVEPGIVVKVRHCDKSWCKLMVNKTGFWMKQEELWGVYPNEAVDG